MYILHLPFLNVVGLNDSLPKDRIGNGKNSNFMVEKPSKHNHNHLTKVNITNIFMCISCTLDMM